MTWVKVDDNLDRQRKIRKAWRRDGRTVGLLIMSLAYSNAERLDGFIDPEWCELQLLETVDWQAPPDVITAMVDEGLWVQMTGGWEIHADYLKHQPTAEEIERVHEAKRMAGQLGAQKRWGKGTDEAAA